MKARLSAAAMYAGGLLGPFGGGAVAAMLPEVAAGLHTTRTGATTSLTAYLAPFAAMQLISGTYGERWGRRRTVRIAYLVYAAASVGCALSPGLGVFLGFRALQGTANAFTSPLLLAGLSDLVPRERLTRAVGLYASMQAAGQSFAPLGGGLAAQVNWRFAFVGITAAALILALVPPPGTPRSAAPPRWRTLVNRRVGLTGAAAFAGFAGSAALSFLVALYAADAFGLEPAPRGLLLAGFGLAGLALGTTSGRLVDRFGARACLAVGAAACAGLVGTVGLITSVPWLATQWALAGAAASLLTVATNSFAFTAAPGNRGGSVSTMMAFRFGGTALAPVLWLPVYHADMALGFAAAASLTVLVVLPAAALWPGPAPGLADPPPAAAGPNSGELIGGRG
jgi:MFS family permease